MKRNYYSILCLFTILFFAGCEHEKPSVITVDMAQKGVEVPSGLWGIFYEEINRAGDGGIWPEMIYNMGFEEKSVPSDCYVEDGLVVPPAKPNYAFGRVTNYKFYHFDPDNKSEGWKLENKGSSQSSMEVVTDNPVNKANPHSLLLKIDSNDEGVELINEGYNGISLVEGEKYDFEFHLRADKTYNGNVIASLVGKTGEAIYTKEFEVNNSGAWTKYESEITSSATDYGVRLILQFTSIGKVWVDYVSLLPQTTFKGHGLRQDIAQILADMKPSFVRWPGGCIVEGMSMENRVKWKQTIGDRMSRPGEFDLWGYHNSCNLGYHEFLQFCEDIGAQGMFVVNAGLSCMVRNGDYYEMDEMGGIVQEALDAIEYAIGDVTTKWGAERAKNGHPEPFPLKYVEIGNENMGSKYHERYNLIYDACVEKYPQLTYINCIGLNNFSTENYVAEKVKMIDPHYYVAPETFFNTVDLFDTLSRDNYEIYIGEYAVNSNVGSGTLEGALAEASFMFGIEHNSDLIKMASYAPLLENVDFSNWPTNLIRFNNHQVFGRSSYYVQKMFNENKPDVTLQSTLELIKPDLSIKGKVGFSATVNSMNQQIEIKNFTVSEGTTTKYSSEFPADTSKWTMAGSWEVAEGAVKTGELKDLSYLTPPGLYIPGRPKDGSGQLRLTSGGYMVLDDLEFNNCTISADLMIDSVFNGFSVRFGVVDDNNYFTLTIRNPRMRRYFMPRVASNQPIKYTASVEQIINGTSIQQGVIGEPFELDAGSWHNIKVEVIGNKINCLVDDVDLGEIDCSGLQRQYAVAGYDNANEELIIKVVNAENKPFSTEINLLNSESVQPEGQVISLTSSSLQDDNNFDEPKKVSPVVNEFSGFSNTFKMDFEPNSFTILRIKVSQQKAEI